MKRLMIATMVSMSVMAGLCQASQVEDTTNIALSATPAATQVPTVVISDSGKAKLDPHLKGKVRSVEYFASQHGLVGIGIVTTDYRPMTLYTNAGGDFLISGMAMDAATGQPFGELDRYVPKMDLSGMKPDLDALSAVTVGNGSQHLYALVDVNCPYCHQTYDELNEMASSGSYDITVHWVPVGILSADSIAKGKAILGATDPSKKAELLAKAMQKQAIEPQADVLGTAENELKANQQFMQSHNFNGVPVVVSLVEGRHGVVTGKPDARFMADLKASTAKPEAAATPHVATPAPAPAATGTGQ